MTLVEETQTNRESKPQNQKLMTMVLIFLAVSSLATLGGIVYLLMTSSDPDQENREQIIQVFEPVYQDMQANPNQYDKKQIQMTGEILEMAKSGAAMEDLRKKTDAYSKYNQQKNLKDASMEGAVIEWVDGQPVVRLPNQLKEKTQAEIDAEERQQILILYQTIRLDMQKHPEKYAPEQIQMLDEILEMARLEAPVKEITAKMKALNEFTSTQNDRIPTTLPDALNP